MRIWFNRRLFNTQRINQLEILNRFKNFDSSDPSQFIGTAVSFYRLKPFSNEQITQIIPKVQEFLTSISAKGTLLLAKEGYNSQLFVPAIRLNQLSTELSDILEDPIFDLNIGESYHVTSKNGIPSLLPFSKLVVKQKTVVLTDKIEPSITSNPTWDWNDNGPEVEAVDWHNELLSNSSIVLDCRNRFESDLGKFQGSEPAGTDIFSETWGILDKRLENVPKDARILTYCTGGIRCEKVNAYLKQHLGFRNIGRLKKGIIAYEQWTKTQTQPFQSVWEGRNYLFDRRSLGPEDQKSIAQ